MMWQILRKGGASMSSSGQCGGYGGGFLSHYIGIILVIFVLLAIIALPW